MDPAQEAPSVEELQGKIAELQEEDGTLRELLAGAFPDDHTTTWEDTASHEKLKMQGYYDLMEEMGKLLQKAEAPAMEGFTRAKLTGAFEHLSEKLRNTERYRKERKFNQVTDELTRTMSAVAKREAAGK